MPFRCLTKQRDNFRSLSRARSQMHIRHNLNDAFFAGLICAASKRQRGVSDAKPSPIGLMLEGTQLQADITLGNLASALSIHAEEATLVAELKAGSEEAFSWLITRYHQPIYSLLARTVRDPADASDLTQEVFVKIFRHIGSFHSESSLRTWIYRIALHEGLNQRRWWRRHKQQEVTIEMETVDCESGEPARLKEMLVDPGESPYEMATHAEARERVESALREVPEPFRTTLILRDIEGFVYEEVADMLGVNLGTVKSRLVRGRACLRKLLLANDAERISSADALRSSSLTNMQSEEAR
jgi:RNA polymerase sigma-70 factor (ECF subfamily)